MIVRHLLAASLKRAGRTTSLDPRLTDRDLAGELVRRGAELVRSAVRLRQLGFLGRGVQLRGSRSLTFGRWAAVGDRSLVDARALNGTVLGAGSKIGRYCTISGTSHLSKVGKGFRLGKNSGIGDFAHIGCSGGVVIGDDVIVGPFATFHSQEHVFDDYSLPIRTQGTVEDAITVGDNVWIGARVTILSGVSIGAGSVVAAGSVVRSSFPEGSIIGGVPARLLRSRNVQGGELNVD